MPRSGHRVPHNRGTYLVLVPGIAAKVPRSKRARAQVALCDTSPEVRVEPVVIAAAPKPTIAVVVDVAPPLL